MSAPQHPRQALFDSAAALPTLPVVDHYCGFEARMVKSLELQAQLGAVIDVTLDCEDGAPVGAEIEHAELVAELVNSGANRFGRVGARVHPVEHPSFEADLDILIGRAGERLAYLMVPKPRGFADVAAAALRVDAVRARHGISATLPLHTLIETHGGLRDVMAIAAHPRIESLSFGLMDFVSAHLGAIPSTAMELAGQFQHPLVVRAKLEIAAAAHCAGKVPSHCVVTEFKNTNAVLAAATRAAREFGYSRMWSIHPNQIQPILDAFSPTTAEVDEAVEIICAAQAANWAPIQHRQRLHDRASYRYFWQLIERAWRTGQPLPSDLWPGWFGQTCSPSGTIR